MYSRFRRGCAAAMTVFGLFLLPFPASAVGPEEGNIAQFEAAPMEAAGNAEGLYDLGIMYHDGKLRPQSLETAADMWRRAAAMGHAPAQYRYGLALTSGLGIAQDRAAARIQFETAAAQNYGPALYRLGQEYAAGTYGAPDLEKAYEYYLSAGDAGTPDAYASAALLKTSGQLSSGYEADDNLEASYLYLMGAEANCLRCMTELARMYENAPIGVEQNLAEALFWYTRAYNMSFTKTDAEFANVTRVSSSAYAAAVADWNAGNHWEAYHAFKTLCDLKGPAACYMLGLYQGAANSPYGKDERAALTPLAFACDHQVPGACETHANLTGYIGPSAGYSNGHRAERFFKSLCNAKQPNYVACFNVAWLNYYTGFGLNDWDTIVKYSGKACWEGGDSVACSLTFKIVDMMKPAAAPSETESGSNWGRGVENAIGAIFGGLVAGAAAYNGSGSSGSYSSSSSSSYSNSSVDRMAAWQSNRDWNQAIRAKSYIGTAYSSSCRPGNPYC